MWRHHAQPWCFFFCFVFLLWCFCEIGAICLVQTWGNCGLWARYSPPKGGRRYGKDLYQSFFLRYNKLTVISVDATWWRHTSIVSNFSLKVQVYFCIYIISPSILHPTSTELTHQSQFILNLVLCACDSLPADSSSVWLAASHSSGVISFSDS